MLYSMFPEKNTAKNCQENAKGLNLSKERLCTLVFKNGLRRQATTKYYKASRCQNMKIMPEII
jgi:hypothetical protein